MKMIVFFNKYGRIAGYFVPERAERNRLRDKEDDEVDVKIEVVLMEDQTMEELEIPDECRDYDDEKFDEICGKVLYEYGRKKKHALPTTE